MTDTHENTARLHLLHLSTLACKHDCEDRTTIQTCYPSTRGHSSSPTADETVGIEVWFILLISVSSAGPWEGSAIKSGLRPGLFNTVSVKWLKVDSGLTPSATAVASESRWIEAGLFSWKKKWRRKKITAQKEGCLSLFWCRYSEEKLLWRSNKNPFIDGAPQVRLMGDVPLTSSLVIL